jgi:hypothetical protein
LRKINAKNLQNIRKRKRKKEKKAKLISPHFYDFPDGICKLNVGRCDKGIYNFNGYGARINKETLNDRLSPESSHSLNE